MFLWILACTGGSTTNDTGFTTPDLTEDTTCASDVDCESWEICNGDALACEVGDRNNAIEEAVPLLWEQSEAAHLQTTGDQDFYSFEAEGGEWTRIDTVADGNDDTDTLVTLYDPIGKVHHVEDDHPWGAVTTYDTVLYTYLPTAGTWTIVVEDLNALGATNSRYEVRLQEVSNAVEEDDSYESPGYDLEVTSSSSIWAIGVLLEEDGDEDFILLDLPYDSCPVYLVGSQGERGSEANATVELYGADGLLHLRKEGLGVDGNAFYPEVDGGQAIIVASDADLDGSQDHWFYVYVQVYDEGYSYTEGAEPNDTEPEATEVTLETSQNSNGLDFAWAGIWGTIDERGDEDWFSFEANPDWFLQVRGNADSLGSLLLPEIVVYDPSGLPVTGTVDADDGFPDVWNIGPLEGGRYTVQVTSSDLADYGPEMYYSARIDVTNYEASISH